MGRFLPRLGPAGIRRRGLFSFLSIEAEFEEDLLAPVAAPSIAVTERTINEHKPSPLIRHVIGIDLIFVRLLALST